MKTTLASILMLTAFSAFAAPKTQQIDCWEPNEKAELIVGLIVDNGKILNAEVQYAGPDLTPGLWRGQKLGSDQTVALKVAPRAIAIIGGSTDPSNDDPFFFEVKIDPAVIGKAGKGARLALRHDEAGKYYYSGPQDIINEYRRIVQSDPTRSVDFKLCSSVVK